MKRLLIIYLFALLMTVTCEGLFSTREAEPPEAQRSSWMPPFSSDLVLQNMQNAILERNVENFTRCLVDTAYSNRLYRFVPTEEVLSSHAEMFISWGPANEHLVMQQMFSVLPEDSLIYLQFLEDTRDVVTADSVIYGRKYHLEFHHVQPELTVDYEGQMELYLAPDERGEWAIYRWIDYSTSDIASWSFLKATLGG